MARICACDHEQSRHKLSKGGCRALDCYCAKFEGSGRTTDMADSAAVETVLPVIEIQPEPVADDGVPDEPRILNAAERGPQPIPPGWSPDGASTLTRLAKAERERDDARVALATAERDRAEVAEKLGAANRYTLSLVQQGDLTEAELASAKQERDQARAALADVEGERKVGEQRLMAAERERDIWRGNTDEQIVLNQQLRAELATAKTLADGFTEEFKRHEAERDGLVSASLNLQGERDEALARVRELEQDIDRDTGEHKLAAELASAQQELERLRAVPVPDVDLEGRLAEARADLAEARQVIEAMEEDLPTNVIQVEYAPTGATLARYDRYFCQPITGCGKTAHQPDDDHECGPLIRATVTITHH